MTTALVIQNEDHGVIGLAKDFQSAVDFLIAGGWITGDSMYYTLEDTWGCDPHPLKRLFLREDWPNAIKEMTDEEIEQFFYGNFYFEKMYVFGA